MGLLWVQRQGLLLLATDGLLLLATEDPDGLNLKGLEGLEGVVGVVGVRRQGLPMHATTHPLRHPR